VIAIRKILRMLGADQRGATAIEYGLIGALIIIAMMGGLSMLGGSTGAMWGKLKTAVECGCEPPKTP
jgi:pilus assembly protein Flp/PilA